MLSIEQIIETAKDSREVKRAIAVKMSQERVKHQNISNYLQVSAAFISKWVMIYEKQGASALLLNYRGKPGYLSEEEKPEVVPFLKRQSYFSVEQLRDYLESQYRVVYKSKQSYYHLLDKGGLNWKKTQKNPKRDEAIVAKTPKSSRNQIQRRSQAIHSGHLRVLIIDECHLCWGDVCG
jgi:putative transposase